MSGMASSTSADCPAASATPRSRPTRTAGSRCLMRSTLACEVPGAMRHPKRTADLGSDMALGPEFARSLGGPPRGGRIELRGHAPDRVKTHLGPDVGTRLRVLVVLSAAAALLVGLAACAPRPIRAPLCEGIAYTGHALNLSSPAIDALETNELAERDDKLNFARASLEQAQGRLEEARRSSDLAATASSLSGPSPPSRESHRLHQRIMMLRCPLWRRCEPR
jgi:hypothetical protein